MTRIAELVEVYRKKGPWLMIPRIAVFGSLICVLAAVAGLSACGSKKTGSATPPGGAQVSAAAKKPADHSALGTTTVQSSPNACAAEDVGLCGCLPEEAWFADGTAVYDVICCAEVGNNFTMHACGEEQNCEDSGTMVVCTGDGGGHS